jgi:hypothetical protein
MLLKTIKSKGNIGKRAVGKLKTNMRLKKIESGTLHKFKP